MRASTLLERTSPRRQQQAEKPSGLTLAETVGAIISMATCGDDGKRNAIARALTRTMGGLWRLTKMVSTSFCLTT